MPTKNDVTEERGLRADRTLASVYANANFMRGVRRAMAEIDAGKKGKPFRELKRKAHA